MIVKTTLLCCFIITKVTRIFHTLVYWLNMTPQVALCCSLMITLVTGIFYTLMYWPNMLSHAAIMNSLIVTFITKILSFFILVQWFLIQVVDTIMIGKSVLEFKEFATVLALVGPLSCVSPHVNFKPCFCWKPLITFTAYKRFATWIALVVRSFQMKCVALKKAVLFPVIRISNGFLNPIGCSLVFWISKRRW